MKRTVLRLEYGYKKLTIEQAVATLQEAKEEGATHVAGLRVRWEELKDKITRGKA